MKASLGSIAAKLTISLVALAITTLASAQNYPTIPNFTIGPSKGEVVGIAIGIGAAGAAIGVGIYYIARHNHSLTGCVISGPNGVQLQNAGDQQTFNLAGQVAEIKPGERVRVSGKKKKKLAGAPQEFLVEKFNKDLGSCVPAPPAT